MSLYPNNNCEKRTQGKKKKNEEVQVVRYQISFVTQYSESNAQGPLPPVVSIMAGEGGL